MFDYFLEWLAVKLWCLIGWLFDAPHVVEA